MAKLIPLNKDKFATVDDSDYDWLSQWHWFFQSNRNGNGYAVRKTTRNSKPVWLKMHREILGAPREMMVDHIDGDGLNNQRCNLRLCDASENAMNTKSRIGSSSKFKGVSWDKSLKVWKAYICADKKTTYLGLFANEVFAARVHDTAARKLHGDFVRLNLPEYAPLTDEEIASCRLKQMKSSRFLGVSRHKLNDSWMAFISIRRKPLYLGSFGTEIEAAAAYNGAAIQYHGDKAKLNILP